MGKKYYVVWEGRDTGVFDRWEDAEEAVKEYPGARYKSYPTQEAAVKAFRGDPSQQMGVLRAIASHQTQHINYEAIPEIRLNAIAVDAACSGNPGPVEYRGVYVATGEEIFRVGPFEGGSNNIGEYLALIHALALLEKWGRPDIPVYSDSVTGLSWLRRRHSNTRIAPTAHNVRLLEVLRRADAWIAAHTPRNPVLKWNTDEWGEIPADFGRK